MSKLRVLVVDDKKKNLEEARLQLQHCERYELILEEHPFAADFEGVDVVLTDLMFPMPKIDRIGKNYDPTKEVPFGFLVMWTAIIKGGIKYVALITGGDPHVDPTAAIIGDLCCTHSGPIQLGDTRVMIVQQYDYKEGYKKDWRRVLEELTGTQSFDYASSHRELVARLKKDGLI